MDANTERLTFPFRLDEPTPPIHRIALTEGAASLEIADGYVTVEINGRRLRLGVVDACVLARAILRATR